MFWSLCLHDSLAKLPVWGQGGHRWLPHHPPSPPSYMARGEELPKDLFGPRGCLPLPAWPCTLPLSGREQLYWQPGLATGGAPSHAFLWNSLPLHVVALRATGQGWFCPSPLLGPPGLQNMGLPSLLAHGDTLACVTTSSMPPPTICLWFLGLLAMSLGCICWFPLTSLHLGALAR